MSTIDTGTRLAGLGRRPSDTGPAGEEVLELLAATPVPALLLDRTLAAVATNDAWRELSGHEPTEGPDPSWWEVVDPSARADFETALSRAWGATPLFGDLKVIDRRRTSRWFRAIGTRLDEHVLLQLVSTSRAARRADELELVVQSMPDLVAVLGEDANHIVWANDAFRALVDLDDRDGLGAHLLVSHLDEWSQARYLTSALSGIHHRRRWSGELTFQTTSGPLPTDAMVVTGPRASDPTCLIARDLSALHDAERRVRASEIRLAALVEHATDMVLVVDAEGQLLYASPAFSRNLGHDFDELLAQRLDLIHPDDRRRAEELSRHVMAARDTSGQDVIRVRDAAGTWRHLELIATNLVHNAAVGGVVVNARDVSDRVAAASELEERAYHDDLTGLPNRAKMLRELGRALDAARAAQWLVGVLYLDLDRFKVVNDSLGHAAGDQLLSEVARRLEATLRPDDVVARLGGDEFVVVIPNAEQRADVLAAAERIRRSIAEPIDVDGETTVVTTSIGVSIAEGHERPEDLLRDSDTALYEAKDAGRDRANVFDDDLRDRAVRRLAVEQKLRSALDGGDIAVRYQPVVRLGDGLVGGAEALVRLPADGGGLLLPGTFMSVAEESGLINPLGLAVLDEACRVAATLSTDERPFEIAVNVSARQLADARFPSLAADVVEAAGIHPGQLQLEITETALIDANPVTERVLHALSDLGFSLGLDDFGTGFSSLVYLKRFPIDFVKVDQAFVRGLGKDENDTAIVRATVALAHSLGLSVIAEGVEHDAQLDLLERLGCDRAQGYLFSPPVSEAEFGPFMRLRWDRRATDPAT